jgi:hypothetical protein
MFLTKPLDGWFQLISYCKNSPHDTFLVFGRYFDFFSPTLIFQNFVPISITKREELFKQNDFGTSLAKNFPSKESSGEEFSASRDFFQAKNYPAKNTPGEEYS